MNIWSVFVTGLFAGGASCAAVQGGLLAGAVARRRLAEAPSEAESVDSEESRNHGPTPGPAEPAEHGNGAASRSGSGRVGLLARPVASSLVDDAAPVAGFMAGKLVSHVAFGALLGLFGAALQPSFRVRAFMLMGAGALMILMAANMFGLLGKRSFVLAPPASFTRLLRRSARAESTFTPVVVGFLTVLVPCGVTLSVEFLIIANGSALTGAAAMGAFVLGTTPLFAALGYAIRRAGAVLGGHLTKLAAVAVAVTGALSINSGLVLSGSGVTLQKVAPGVAAAVPQALGGGKAAMEGLSGRASSTDQSIPTARVGADGVQLVDISVSYGEPEGGGAPFAPTIVQAKAGLPTRLTFHAAGDLGCAGVVVIQKKGIEKGLKPGGETSVDLGVLVVGDIGYSCGTGMYGGVIKVLDA